MTSRDKIIDRIKKLVELSGSPNKHEAASAKRLAAALKKRHRVRRSEIEARPDKDHRVDAGGQSADPYWWTELARAIGGKLRCTSLKKDGRIYFEGKDADQAARQYQDLAAQTIAACQKSWRTDVVGIKGSLYLVWSTTFKAEAVRTIARRLAGRAEQVAPAGFTQAGFTQAFSHDDPPAPSKQKTPDEAQLERACWEVEMLVFDLSPVFGVHGARIHAAGIVDRAAKAGRAFGEGVYLGGVPLISGKVEKVSRTSRSRKVVAQPMVAFLR